MSRLRWIQLTATVVTVSMLIVATPGAFGMVPLAAVLIALALWFVPDGRGNAFGSRNRPPAIVRVFDPKQWRAAKSESDTLSFAVMHLEDHCDGLRDKADQWLTNTNLYEWDPVRFRRNIGRFWSMVAERENEALAVVEELRHLAKISQASSQTWERFHHAQRLQRWAAEASPLLRQRLTTLAAAQGMAPSEVSALCVRPDFDQAIVETTAARLMADEPLREVLR